MSWIEIREGVWINEPIYSIMMKPLPLGKLDEMKYCQRCNMYYYGSHKCWRRKNEKRPNQGTERAKEQEEWRRSSRVVQKTLNSLRRTKNI